MQLSVEKCMSLINGLALKQINITEQLAQQIFEVFIKNNKMDFIMKALNYIVLKDNKKLIDYLLINQIQYLYFYLQNNKINKDQNKDYIFNCLMEIKNYNWLIKIANIYNDDTYNDYIIQQFLNGQKCYQAISFLINNKKITDTNTLKEILKIAKEQKQFQFLQDVLKFIFYSDHELSYQILDYLKQKKQYKQLSNLITKWEIQDDDDVETITSFLIEEKKLPLVFDILNSIEDYNFIEKTVKKIINNVDKQQEKIAITNLYNLILKNKIKSTDLKNKILQFFINNKITHDTIQ